MFAFKKEAHVHNLPTVGPHLTRKDNKHFHISWRVERILRRCRKFAESIPCFGDTLSEATPLTWQERHKLQRMRTLLLKGLKFDAASVPVLSLLGRVDECLGDMEGALSWLEKAACLEGSEVDNISGASYCALALQRLDKAQQLCEEALKRQPYEGLLHVNHAIVQLLSGNVWAARHALAQAFKTVDAQSAAAVAAVIDRCELLAFPYPTTYVQYDQQLGLVKAEQIVREARKV